MPTIFTRIIDGEIPGRLIWADDTVIAMIDIRPLNRGHVLVIPRQEVDQWIDLPEQTNRHLMAVAQAVAQAQREVFRPQRVGLMIAGFEVPHTHLHVVPMDSMAHLDFANADPSAQSDELDAVADDLREALRRAGHGDSVPTA